MFSFCINDLFFSCSSNAYEIFKFYFLLLFSKESTYWINIKREIGEKAQNGIQRVYMQNLITSQLWLGSNFIMFWFLPLRWKIVISIWK